MTNLTPGPDAVLVAPDGCTRYLASAVERDLNHMRHDAVLEVRCATQSDQLDLAEWCLHAGKRILNRFDHWSIETLIVQNTGGPARTSWRSAAA